MLDSIYYLLMWQPDGFQTGLRSLLISHYGIISHAFGKCNQISQITDPKLK